MRKRNDTKGIVALIIALMMLTVSLIAFAEQGTIVTGGGRLNMRKEADEKAKIVTKIKNGSTVDVLDHADGWYHIRYNGKEGYVQEKYVRVLSEAVGKEIYSNGETLYLREAPDESSAIVGLVNAQGSVRIEQVSDQWVLISSADAKGYVQASEIDKLNDTPVKAATQILEEGILQKETKLYKEPDTKSEVLSTWPKGTGVRISVYNKKWCLVQIADEGSFGFTPFSAVSIEPLPKETDKVDDSKFTITASGAKKKAEKALKKYPGFKASNYTCKQESMYSCEGITGPLYRFAYLNKKGQMIYAAFVHCYTAEVLYTGDYSGFEYDKGASDLKTAPPQTTQEPGYVIIKGEVVWDSDVTPSTPIPGDDMGKEAARAIADRYLKAHYPRFSEIAFTGVECRHWTAENEPQVAAGFREPSYQFIYYTDDWEHGYGQPQYVIEIYAFSGVIKNVSGPGEGNG